MLIACLLKWDGNSLQTDVGITRKASRIILRKGQFPVDLVADNLEKNIKPKLCACPKQRTSHVLEKKV